MIEELEQVNFMQVARSQNLEVDKVAKYASLEDGTSSSGLMLEMQKFPSIKEFHTFLIQGNTSRTTPILSYLKNGQLQSDLDEAKKIKKQATRFTLLNYVLYKRGFSLPYLRCVRQDEARYILEEVHEGVFGEYSGARSLVAKFIKAGYF